MATGLTNVGHAFGGPPTSSTFQSTSVDDDDDVVFIEPVQVAQNTVPVDQRNVGYSLMKNDEFRRVEAKSVSSTKDLDSLKGTISETIIIDDEEDSELNQVQDKNASSLRSMDPNRPINTDFSTPSGFSRNKGSTGMMNVGITTEPDSEIQIANVTTLETGISDSHVQNVKGRDMNLMITHVTSLQNPSLAEVPNGVQSSNFGVNVQTYPPPPGSQSKTAMGPYNPGRINVSGEVFQNGESATHPNPDSWISQSASFPRNQKQPVVDSLSPVASLPKQVMQPSPQQQQPPKAVKVTCANCKKPLQKGQTAYQRKGSTHLFCSTACLSSFSHKPAPKKLCTMCKKDITTMKGTIVAQVDSSESFQEFCSTYCLSVYEDKQNSAKNQNKSRCTICGKLTEIRHEVSFKNMTHKLCSDHCFNRYRMANGLIMNCCEQCGEYLPSKGAGNNILMVEGQWKRFCSPVCLSDFKMKHGKLTSCTGCKAQCRCFDMTQCIGTNGHMEPYCSTVCMNNHKAKLAKPQNMGIICHFCKRNSLPQYQATMPDGKMYNFCSSNCVAKFQTLSMQSTQNGQHSSTSDIQLKCNYCKNVFSSKPETLEWENKVSQFCSTNCCEDYKKLHCIVTYCEYCQEEKTLHDTMKFSGVKKPFCSEGCKLLYKQDFARRLGLKCVTCNYCFQMCKRGATKEYDGMLRDFCSEDCSKKFHDWYYKAARCDCCRTQGVLREKVQWRGTIKNFCDPQCLLRFYSQQNEPNMSTQKGPENMHYDQAIPSSRTRAVGINSSTPAVSKDMKNKAVLCKPLSMTKATYCKPHMQTKTCQTEEDDKLNSDSNEKLKQDPEEKLKQDPEEKLKQDPEEKLKQDPEEKLKQDPVEIIKHVPVPIPVPVFVPVPMHLYCRNIPTPTIIPIPVPVPVFLPSDLDSIEKVFAVEKSKTKSPLHPTELESNLTLFSEPVVEEPLVSEDISDEEVAEKETLKSCSTESPAALSDAPFGPDLDIELVFPQGEDVAEKETLKSCSTGSPAALSDAPFEPDLDIELDFPQGEKVVEKETLKSCSTESPAALSDVPYEPDLDIELDFPRATEELDTENEFLLPPVFGEEYEEQPKPQALKKGKKRKAILDFQTHDDCSENSESSFPFKYCYGVNAWKHWVKTRKVNTDDSEESNSTISVKLKEDILLHPPSDLNYWLSQFVNEVRRPNGENYAPDSIYYLCLGIQEFLTGSNRKDNIFIDSDYQDFAEEFNKIIKSWQPSILPDGSIFSRLEEDYLWQLNQLGSHSPTTLLFTLFYFNTKYFNLKTVEQHMRLSFGTVFRQLKKNPLTKENKACLQYQVSSLCENDSEGKIEIGKRKHEDDEPVFEQIENTADPSRCPVKMFEYYLSRSPQNLNQRMDVFYLKPESSASADSPFWYTSTSLDRNTLENMLIRVLLVKDIYEKNSYELDEETD